MSPTGAGHLINSRRLEKEYGSRAKKKCSSVRKNSKHLTHVKANRSQPYSKTFNSLQKQTQVMNSTNEEDNVDSKDIVAMIIAVLLILLPLFLLVVLLVFVILVVWRVLF